MTNDISKLVAKFREYFPMNPSKFGVMTAYDAETGKKTSTTKSKPVTVDMIESHLRRLSHSGRLGMLPGYERNTTVGCIDVDTEKFPGIFEHVVTGLQTAISSSGVTPYIETSTNGGKHVWIWSVDPVPYEDMYYFLKYLCLEAGHPMLETFPSGANSGVEGKWVYLPYSGAFEDPARLGMTFLRDRHGNEIPIYALDTINQTPSSTILKYSALFQEELLKYNEENKIEEESVQDLSEKALDQMIETTLSPPEKFPRHDALISFLNIAYRAGIAERMAKHLASQEVYNIWIPDGSRSLPAWKAEVNRWYETMLEDRSEIRGRFGIKSLLNQGWVMPSLKRRPEALLKNSKNINTIPQSELTEAIAEIAWKEGWRFDTETYQFFQHNGKTFVHKDEMQMMGWLEGKIREFDKSINQSMKRNIIQKFAEYDLRDDLTNDLDPRYICCKNGLYNVQNRQLEPHTQAVKTVGMVNANYNPNTKGGTAFYKFLKRLFARRPEEEANASEIILSEFVGYGISNLTTSRQMLELHGPSTTGKSTLLRVVADVFGSDFSGTPGLTMITDQDIFTAQDWALHMVGKNLVMFDEMSTADKRAGQGIIQKLKVLAGNSPVFINPKGRQGTNAVLGVKLIFNTNVDLRMFEDASNDSVLRRIIRLNLDNVIKRSEERGNYVEEKLLADESDREAVFLWATLGLSRYLENGKSFSHVGVIEENIESVREAANPVVEFLKSFTKVAEGMETSVDVLWEEYKIWATMEGMSSYHREISKRGFGMKLKSAIDVMSLGEFVHKYQKSASKDPARPWVWKNLYLVQEAINYRKS